MLTTKARVIVDRVGPIGKVLMGTSENRRQLLYITQPGYVNLAQNIENKPDLFEVQLWNAAIDKFDLLKKNLNQKTVYVELNVKGRRYMKNGEETYETFTTLKSLELVK